MAIVSRVASSLWLELDGKPAASLRSAQPPSLQVELADTLLGPDGGARRSARVVLGELSASADLVEAGPLTDWLQAAFGGALPARDGALLVADANLQLQRRIAFRGARLAGLAWAVLDATDGKRPVTLSLRWLADSVDDGPATGKATGTGSRRKGPLAGNFRVTGLPFDATTLRRVELPELQVTWVSDRVGGLRPGQHLASRQFGPLSLTVAGRQVDAARSWVRKLLADGSIVESEGLALQVELLDATLKKVLATVQLQGCLLTGMDEPALESGGAERLSELTLHFDVAGMRLSLV